MSRFNIRKVDPILRAGYEVVEDTAHRKGNPIENILEAQEDISSRLEMLSRNTERLGFVAAIAGALAGMAPHFLHHTESPVVATSITLAVAGMAYGLMSGFNARGVRRDAKVFTLVANQHAEEQKRKDPDAAINSPRYAKKWMDYRLNNFSKTPFSLDTPSSHDKRPARLRERVMVSLKF